MASLLISCVFTEQDVHDRKYNYLTRMKKKKMDILCVGGPLFSSLGKQHGVMARVWTLKQERLNSPFLLLVNLPEFLNFSKPHFPLL